MMDLVPVRAASAEEELDDCMDEEIEEVDEGEEGEDEEVEEVDGGEEIEEGEREEEFFVRACCASAS